MPSKRANECVLIVSAGLLALAAGGARAADVEQAARALEQKYAEAADHGDLNALMALYDDDAILMPISGGTFTGPDEIRRYYEQTGAGRDVEIKPTRIEPIGDMVLDVGTFSLTAPQPAGAEAKVSGEYVAVLEQKNGQWKIHRLTSFATRGAGQTK